MAQQGYILPAEPLFMVERGWLRPAGSPGHPHQSSDSLKITPVPYSKRTTDHLNLIEISGSAIAKASSATSSRKRDRLDVISQVGQFEQRRINRFHLFHKHSNAATGTGDLLGKRVNDHSIHEREAVVPHRALTIFPVQNLDPLTQKCKTYLHYYPEKIGKAVYPIEKYVKLEMNPIRKFWFPLALNDTLFLHSALYVSMMHHAVASSIVEPQDAKMLLQSILVQLNYRLSHQITSDATLGAVSCLASTQDMLGDQTGWELHTSGMYQMLRLRKESKPVHDDLQMKLHRVDVLGSVDRLSKPRLVRSRSSSPLLTRDYKSDIVPSPDFVSLLVHGDLDPRLIKVYFELSRLSSALELAIEASKLIPPRQFDEDTLFTQQELLEFDSGTGLDNVLRCAAIIYLQTLTREKPFAKGSSIIIAKRMRTSFEEVPSQAGGETLMYWASFMGCLISQETEDKAWFLTNARRFNQTSSVGACWVAEQARLKRVLWISTIHHQHGIHIWNAIQES